MRYIEGTLIPASGSDMPAYEVIQEKLNIEVGTPAIPVTQQEYKQQAAFEIREQTLSETYNRENFWIISCNSNEIEKDIKVIDANEIKDKAISIVQKGVGIGSALPFIGTGASVIISSLAAITYAFNANNQTEKAYKIIRNFLKELLPESININAGDLLKHCGLGYVKSEYPFNKTEIEAFIIELQTTFKDSKISKLTDSLTLESTGTPLFSVRKKDVNEQKESTLDKVKTPLIVAIGGVILYLIFK